MVRSSAVILELTEAVTVKLKRSGSVPSPHWMNNGYTESGTVNVIGLVSVELSSGVSPIKSPALEVTTPSCVFNVIDTALARLAPLYESTKPAKEMLQSANTPAEATLERPSSSATGARVNRSLRNLMGA